MDTLPLPPRPDLAQYRKRAKGLVRATQSTDPDALDHWSRKWLTSLLPLLGIEQSDFVRQSIDRAVRRIAEWVLKRRAEVGGEFSLADAQWLLARAHGFDSWATFTRHVGDAGSTTRENEFERAADAVVSGDLATLTELVRANPALIRQHSERVHHATLLHYVAANGVEDFRQKTPANAVAIARFLLEAGARPDALADTYGGDTLQTTLNLLVSSVHPAKAGLQVPIAEALIDHGAALNGVADDESPLLTALSFGYRDVAEALARRGARVDAVTTAAALGRLDLLREMVIDARTLKPGVPLVSARWTVIAPDPRVHLEFALAWACKFARSEVATFLLELGVNPAGSDNHQMTPLHWAAANGMMPLIDDLLRRGAPLEVENAWGGTVLNSTLHFTLIDPVPGVDYLAVLRRLLNAGANVRVVDYPTGDAAVEGVLGEFRRGS